MNKLSWLLFELLKKMYRGRGAESPPLPNTERVNCQSHFSSLFLFCFMSVSISKVYIPTKGYKWQTNRQKHAVTKTQIDRSKKCWHTHIHWDTHINTHTHIHAQTHTFTPANKLTNTCSHKQTNINMYKPTHTHK